MATNLQQEQEIYKLLIVGDSHVGKTSLLIRFADECFTDTYLSTLGVDFRIKRVVVNASNNSQTVKLQIWDTAGQERFQTITQAYYRNAHGIIIVYDITNRESFASVETWLSQVNRLTNSQVCTLLVGNKADLCKQRTICKADAQRLAGKLGLLFVETSAKDEQNKPSPSGSLSSTFSVEQVFSIMAHRMHQARHPTLHTTPSTSKLVQTTLMQTTPASAPATTPTHQTTTTESSKQVRLNIKARLSSLSNNPKPCCV